MQKYIIGYKVKNKEYCKIVIESYTEESIKEVIGKLCNKEEGNISSLYIKQVEDNIAVSIIKSEIANELCK